MVCKAQGVVHRPWICPPQHGRRSISSICHASTRELKMNSGVVMYGSVVWARKQRHSDLYPGCIRKIFHCIQVPVFSMHSAVCTTLGLFYGSCMKERALKMKPPPQTELGLRIGVGLGLGLELGCTVPGLLAPHTLLVHTARRILHGVPACHQATVRWDL